ncbi:beta-phosphoglucomutase-like phosphatase (HAD superfamily) [Saccharothrix ecbatanensis]|uniref:Beta-phosphoglucomutase-like phosphatase (HAD superfamily) n=1 Tax=Saccharothrix ecbatanensis TaxID=1105145 RepID=A0A7W9M422_9PSEU|nr:HAD hydrolase-like protein [Saccharothrix ecbatanensis]MBB5806650.1 beta-phosphoglucomutase-like phosphatase (HAD superfamily) [Saccharothrix ecbatanensis]
MRADFVQTDDLGLLRHILSSTDALLLDFDGPICSVFAGIPARHVADQLRKVLSKESRDSLPPDIETTEDPFDILRYAATVGDTEAQGVEVALRAYEVEAVASASPTVGGLDVIAACHDRGRMVAVVSNNSAECVRTYLRIKEVEALVDAICARTTHDTSMLKPASTLLTAALTTLNVPPEAATLVGDSETDIQAALHTQVHSVGYANKPGKEQKLRDAGAHVIIDRMTQISDVL